MTLFFVLAMAAVAGCYGLLFAFGAKGTPAPSAEDARRRPLMVIVIAVRNQEAVVGGTIRAVLASGYGGPSRILVVDEASTDRTLGIVSRLSAADPRVRVLRRSPAMAARGKREALNHAYRYVARLAAVADPWLLGCRPVGIVLCVLDAGNRLSPGALDAVAAHFADPTVGAVQLGVQMADAATGVLARMQDMELVGFRFTVQRAHDRLGTARLEANGQCTRMSALAELGDRPWPTRALSDADPGVRLAAAGWRLRFCPTAWVDQQGLRRLGPLVRRCAPRTRAHQRRRGLASLSANGLDAGPLGTSISLMVVAMVALASGVLAGAVLTATGVLTPGSGHLSSLGESSAVRAAVVALSSLPVLLIVMTYQRRAVNPLRWWEWPWYSVLFALYVYLRALATIGVWGGRLALRRRVGTQAASTASSEGRHASVRSGSDRPSPRPARSRPTVGWGPPTLRALGPEPSSVRRPVLRVVPDQIGSEGPRRRPRSRVRHTRPRSDSTGRV